MIYAYCALALLFAVLRTSGVMVSPGANPHVTESLKALAHLFDGAMLVGGGLGDDKKYAMALGWGLAAVELITFLATRS